MKISLENALRDLNSPDSLVRFTTCYLVGEQKIPIPNEEVVARLNDTDPTVRAKACFMAHMLETDVTSEQVLRLFSDPSYLVRHAAMLYFGNQTEIRSNISNYTALQLLLDPDESVRKTAQEVFAPRINSIREWVADWIPETNH